MNENNFEKISVQDFEFICRVCLQVGENMVDIFQSGINNRIMEVTNIEMELDDKLPKALCQKCNQQINELFRFLQQAKSSDTYLRSILSSCELKLENVEALDIETLNERNSWRKKLGKWQKKPKIKNFKSYTESDKIYLIFVPDANSKESHLNSDICIKDLNLDDDNNLELSNYCRTLVRSYASDHTYPKEQSSFSEIKYPQIKIIKSNFFTKSNENSEFYAVNFDVYECSECQLTFEELNDLTAHLLTHNVESSFIKNSFICPVCDFLTECKIDFLGHLKVHKAEGVLFVKVNSKGDSILPRDNEEHLLTTTFVKDFTVYSLNLDLFNCAVCSGNIQLKDDILDHLALCLSKDKSDIEFNIKYSCPVCSTSITNEEINFIEHLKSHKNDNICFIKVDNKGNPVKPESNDQLWLPFEEAEKLFSKGVICEIINMNSCDKCDFTSENFSELCDHKSIIHSDNVSSEILFSCPICLEEFKTLNINQDQTQFFEHLKTHVNEGVSFVLVNKNRKVAALQTKYSDVFTQSQFFWCLINSSTIWFQSISPELVILNEESPAMKYTCDLCKKMFKKRQEFLRHLKFHQVEDVSFHKKKSYICDRCGKKCSGKLNYKKHSLKHLRSASSVVKHPTCTICNKTFANRATLNGHMKNHLRENNGNEFSDVLPGIMCEKCGKSFSNNASLTKHKKIHLKEKENSVFKCEICNRDFYRQSSFDRHISAHFNPKYFECTVCKLPLPSMASLQKHSETHKNGSNTFDCKACKLSFLTKDSLTAHQTHTGHYLDRKPLECNVCHEKFFIGRKFTEHIKTHPKYKMGKCTLCGKRLSTIQSLMLHMGRHFESNSILCPHCGKQFFEERNYHRHLLTHEGIKPFSCDTEGCKKSFYTLFELNRHKKYHNNTRDFNCPYCSKSFHEANHLTVHIRAHTGERPYSCPHCNKGFVTRTHCKHHIKLVHQGVGYDLIRSSISKKVTVFEPVV